MSIWMAVLGAMALTVVGLVVRLRKKRQSLSVLVEREALSEDEIYQHFYATSGLSKAAVSDVWHEVAHVLQVPGEHLRPSDILGKDIGSHWITSEELDALGVVAQKRAKRQGIAIDLESIKTIDDYVRHLAPRN